VAGAQRRATDVSNAGCTTQFGVAALAGDAAGHVDGGPWSSVLMAVAVYVVVSRALFKTSTNQLQTRARLLIESGSCGGPLGKAIEGTGYSDVNAMLVNPGRAIYAPTRKPDASAGQPEKDSHPGPTASGRCGPHYQRVLHHLSNGSRC